jgi:broad-specificity NMP kinase
VRYIRKKEQKSMTKKLVILCATCGVGKSTVKNYLKEKSTLGTFVFYDIDEMGLNWHNYKNLPNGSENYSVDCLKIANQRAGDKNILFASCINPLDYEEFSPIEDIAETYFVNLQCTDEQLYKRLKGRPKERMTDSDDFIESQVEYMNWFRNNTHRMNCIIDNTNLTVEETAELVESFLKKL